MDAIAFSMDGEPRGKGRPRTAVRGGFARIYTDAKTRAYETAVRVLAKQAMGRTPPFEGALSVSLRFRLAVPKSTPKWLRAKYLAGEEAYFGANDLDNMTKAVLDGMNGVVFADDKQVVRSFQTKVAAERPGVDIKVTPAHERRLADAWP